MHVLGTGRVVVAIAGVLALAAPAAARADAVTTWSLTAQSAILSTNPPAHVSTLSSAMVQGAVYDAVNAIDGGYQPYLVKPAASPFDSRDAAVATAAYLVLVNVVPSQAANLLTTYNAAIGAIADGAAKANGIAVGTTTANAMLAARANDGRMPLTTPYPFAQGTTPGAWRVSPPLTAVEPGWWVGNVAPFMISSRDAFRTDGPNALTSAAYAEDFNEVKSLGALHSTTRTADQTSAAVYWQSPPIFLWGGLARTLSTRFGLTSAENARLFAMVALAQADASISCWNDKYYWNFWRPLDAIRQADTDGNDATEADPSWKALFDPEAGATPGLATPNFPDHPSGHSCNSSATLNVMQDFFGTDKIAFDLISTRFAGTPASTRHFDRLSHALKEVIDARVWGGIQFRTADTAGAVIGKKVAHWERKHYFQPVG